MLFALTFRCAFSVLVSACALAACTRSESVAPSPTPSPPLAASLPDTPRELPCTIEKNLRSSAGGAPVELRITNATPTDLRLYWVDFTGARKLYSVVPPAQSVVERTFSGHPWIATDMQGRCLALWIPETGEPNDHRVTTVLPPAPAAPLPPTSLPPPSPALGLSSFYVKYMDAGGIPIVSSAKVRDESLTIARDLVNRMLKKRPDARARIVAAHVRVAIMAPTEQTLDIPEHADLVNVPTDRPGMDWNDRARGLGATLIRPATSCGEENLLCLQNDRYRGENILIHEFGHTIHEIGIAPGDPAFQADLERALASAKAKGLWKNTYAATNPSEYWAEGVQDWFDTNLSNVSEHNEIHTRAQLKTYDPALYALLARAFDDDAWRYQCPPK